MAKKKKISQSIKGERINVQGVSLNSYANFGLNGVGKLPSIVSKGRPAIVMRTGAGDRSVENLEESLAFNDTVGSTANDASTTGGKKRELVPSFQLDAPAIGQPERLDLSSVFVDRAKMTVSSATPDLSTGLVARYLGATALKDERFNGTAIVFGGYPVDPVVYSGSKEESTPLVGTFGAGTKDHFPGETVIANVFDTKASECRGFIDGATFKLTMLTATGSFFALDIENTPFTDAVEKTLTYEGLTDSSIMSSFPLAQTGSVHNEALLPNERFATSGFTYDVSQYGPDNFGTDSVTFGGGMK